MSIVLIVEDEPIIARLYQKALAEDGFEKIIVAIGGKEGLAQVKNENPSVVLLDIMMPEPNGMQVLEELKANEKTKNIPVIMLTNLSGKHDAELAMKKGAFDYWVKKEIQIKDLLSKVKTSMKLVEKGKTIGT